MKVKKLDIVRFAPKGVAGFYDTVIEKVNAYFKDNKISPYANREMWLKTFVMLSLYFGPYILIVSGIGAVSPWLFFGLWFVMGWGMSGIGMGIMHDANHGTYSANKRVNGFLSHILEIIGGYKVTWRIQHNILHHTYTNVSGLDEDIDSKMILRFSPRQPIYWYHRYQYIYAWFFYMMTSLFWMTAKDYIQATRYKKLGLLVKQKTSFGKAIFNITFYKLLYYTNILLLPILFSGMPWYIVLMGFLLMHFTGGFFLTCIFQLAHVMETSAYKMPMGIVGERRMKDSWAIHEVVNTTDFAPKNRPLSWFVGGLNYQIEHHLFSGICHVHYRKLAPIVRSTMESYGLVYQVQPSFLSAMWGHAKMLKKLGRE